LFSFYNLGSQNELNNTSNGTTSEGTEQITLSTISSKSSKEVATSSPPSAGTSGTRNNVVPERAMNNNSIVVSDQSDRKQDFQFIYDWFKTWIEGIYIYIFVLNVFKLEHY
jgi:hypothetical protein